MKLGKGRPLHYSPEKCFEAWISSGSLKKAVQYLYQNGIVNTVGNPPNVPSIQKAAYRYILENPKGTRQALIERVGMQNLGIESEWIGFQIQAAILAFGKRSPKYATWLVVNDLWEVAIRLRLAPKRAEEFVP